MLLQIGERPVLAEADVSGALLECHARIRHFGRLAEKIALAEHLAPVEVRDAADALLRYFGEAMPLHQLDEDESLLPRLRASQQAELSGALTSMFYQHIAIEGILDALKPKWHRLTQEPESIVRLRPFLKTASTSLRELLEQHLRLEEETIFPALNALAHAERVQVRKEMRARRS